MKPILIHKVDGEYSTAVIGNMIETVWFPNEGESRLVGRSTFEGIARRHIESNPQHEGR